MAELRTEEEQVEALKKWWKENGKTLVLGVLFVGAGFFSFNTYQNNQATKAEAASALYNQLIQLTAQPQQTEAVLGSQQQLATELKTTYGKTAYGEFGTLFLARFAADAGDFDTAAAELETLLKSSNEPVKYTATARLAQVLIQQEKFDDALALVNEVPNEAYAVQFEEAKGDALLRKGELVQAREAYARAAEAAQKLGVNAQPLQRKADSLAAAGDN